VNYSPPAKKKGRPGANPDGKNEIQYRIKLRSLRFVIKKNLQLLAPWLKSVRARNQAQ
jgi:hypothetical protein